MRLCMLLLLTNFHIGYQFAEPLLQTRFHTCCDPVNWVLVLWTRGLVTLYSVVSRLKWCLKIKVQNIVETILGLFHLFIDRSFISLFLSRFLFLRWFRLFYLLVNRHLHLLNFGLILTNLSLVFLLSPLHLCLLLMQLNTYSFHLSLQLQQTVLGLLVHMFMLGDLRSQFVDMTLVRL